MTGFVQKIKTMYGRRRKRGIASVIGGVIIFAILFSVGYAYFLTAQQDYKSIQNSSQAASQELFSVTGLTGQNNVTLTIKNQGPIAITIQSIVIVNETSGTLYGKTYVLDYDPTTPNLNYHNQFPFSLNPQTSSKTINTLVPINSSIFLIEAITARGTIATATVSNQPAPASQLALQALTSGALGDIYISFNSYSYYNVTTTNCPSQGSSIGGDGLSSGYCLSPGKPAFTIPHNDPNSMAYGITFTNLNAQEAQIVLDQFSLLYQVVQGANAKGTYYSWFIASNQTNGGHNVILENYNPIILNYNTPTTVIFLAANCVASSAGPNLGCAALPSAGFAGVPGSPGAGYTSTVFIMTHGWEMPPYINLAKLSYSGVNATNYGQNLPYVSTVWT
jgi:hypothetical protein